MVAHIISSSALAAVLFCFSAFLSVAADEGLDVISLESTSPALALAKDRYVQARNAYEEQIEGCLQVSKRKLQGNPFQGMNLSAREKEVTAFVMAGRAMRKCEAETLGHFAVEIGSFKAVAAHYGVGLPLWVHEDEQLLFSQRWRQLEKESTEFAALSMQQRAQIEQHPAFQGPFDFVDMLSRLRGEGK